MNQAADSCGGAAEFCSPTTACSTPTGRLRCPLLVLHGGRDPIVELADQRPFVDAADTGDATLQVWDDGEHTIYNHSAERTAVVADWFAARFSVRK
ncbi:lysophospholipase [Nocardia sp. NEAU-G5]|uniref:Lysophospholipase n=1 Tax=Nocardia albiluteola TaxID=2842303 RepID=A0ABS6AWD6_9NOCA|nr:alpha/beta hydrolase [Nocardia albiluteola]MBU3062359.1 lysophospholipase [Nocardia albiluteola]